MRRGRILIALVIVGVLAVPFSVFAATSDSTAAKAVRGFFGIDTSKLTNEQKAVAADYSKRIADLQKEFIDKMVQNGSMTKADGDTAKQKIDQQYKTSQDNNGVYGLTPGKGTFGGFERQRGPGGKMFDFSKLTDQQKTDISGTVKKINDLNRSFIDTAVGDGLLTQIQGDTIKSKLDAVQSRQQGANPGAMGMPGLLGGGCFGLIGNDTSKMTDKQKTDINDYKQKLSDLRKELVGKYVAAGVMTSDQGDAMLKKMEQNPGTGPSRDFGKGMMKGKGFRGNKMMPGNSNNSAAPAVAPAL